MNYSNDLTTCKTCGGTISKNAGVCPHCGAHEPTWSQNKKKVFLTCIFLIIFISLVVILISVLGDNGVGSEKITLSEFNQIRTGMSYNQVCEIIGGKGELMSSVDLDIGYEYATQIYTWWGNGYEGSNANITFQGGKVVAKAQIGLE